MDRTTTAQGVSTGRAPVTVAVTGAPLAGAPRAATSCSGTT